MPREVLVFENGATWYQTVKLPEDVVTYLWKSVEEAKTLNVDERNKLAGNISSSLKLEDKENVILSKVFPELYESNERNIKNLIDSIFKPFAVDKNVNFEVSLTQLWVNFQKKYEFNPLHVHTGALSFVVWMDIPYDWKDEQELEFVKHSNPTNTVGNFVFYYHNGKEITNQVIPMSPEMNGTMALFPSSMSHCVYPFYTSDKERITISGNIIFNPAKIT
jgi:hypothetical protein